jgi:hypothetical protein
MATYTRAELIRRALQEIAALDANETPEAEDYKIANEHAQQMLEMLYEDGLIPFDVDTNAIPARYFLPLVSKVSYRLMTPFSAFDRAEALLANDQGADRRLNKLRQASDIPSVTQAEYF